MVAVMRMKTSVHKLIYVVATWHGFMAAVCSVEVPMIIANMTFIGCTPWPIAIHCGVRTAMALLVIMSSKP
ncbi:hypothetical protein BV900_27390 [Agrobacterium tumefaciens]|nr:hypothetical protein BV900_27390 [Agrobacterium tumefaciens]